MEPNTRSRSELKSYFVRNAIPTESNFTDLVDGLLNQKDDRILKQSDSPLSLEGVGTDDTSQKPILRLYQDFANDNADWTLKLKSEQGKPGFNVVDGKNISRLFIDQETGNVGIGATDPSRQLTIFRNNAAYQSIQDGTREILTGVDRNGGIVSVMTNHPLILRAGGNSEKMRINANGDVGIGTSNPAGKLDVICGGSGSWNRLVITPTGEWGDSNATHVTIGAGGASGIMLSNPHVTWRSNRASIRYGRSGGTGSGGYWDVGTRGGNSFSFSYNGDNSHKLWLNASGNIGIGTTNPHEKLTLNGSIGFTNGTQPMMYIYASGTSNEERPIIAHSPRYKNWGMAYRDKGDILFFQRSGTPVLSINLGNQRVGIGTNDPQCSLNIVGNRIRVTDSRKTSKYIDIRADGGALDVQAKGGDLYINAGGGTTRVYNAKHMSSEEVKNSIQLHAFDEALSILQELRPVTFAYKTDEEQKLHIGFIAEQTPEILTSSDRKAIDYNGIVAILTNIVRQQQRQLNDLQAKVR